MGLGTGLNAFMTLLETQNSNRTVTYHGIEAYPISLEHAKQLNYPKLLNHIDKVDQFLQIHSSEWNVAHQMTPHFNFTKFQQTIETVNLPGHYQIIYFDAFAPSAQPELWEEALLKKMYDYLDSDGILVTYCAKGVFKRTLKKIGFEIEAIPGPPGKREMTRAIKR